MHAESKSGTLILVVFKEFLDEVGHDKATLVMHTDARDPHGQDLPHIIEHLGVGNGQVLLSTNKVGPEDLAIMYNAADFTIGISDAEGFWFINTRVVILWYTDNCHHDRRPSRTGHKWKRMVWLGNSTIL